MLVVSAAIVFLLSNPGALVLSWQKVQACKVQVSQPCKPVPSMLQAGMLPSHGGVFGVERGLPKVIVVCLRDIGLRRMYGYLVHITAQN